MLQSLRSLTPGVTGKMNSCLDRHACAFKCLNHRHTTTTTPALDSPVRTVAESKFGTCFLGDLRRDSAPEVDFLLRSAVSQLAARIWCISETIWIDTWSSQSHVRTTLHTTTIPLLVLGVRRWVRRGGEVGRRRSGSLSWIIN